MNILSRFKPTPLSSSALALPVLLLAILVSGACTTSSSPSPKVVQPAPQIAVAQPSPPPVVAPPIAEVALDEPKARLVDVWLIPLEGFPNGYVTDLTERLTKDTGLYIRATVAAGRSPTMYFPDGKQMDSSKVISGLRPAISRLSYSTTPKTAYIILTTDDINQSDRSLRFVFASTHPEYQTAVVSIARMQMDQSPTLTKLRLFKMTKKAIGTLYYHHPRNTDMSSVMYSPIMGVDDLDMIGTAY